MSSVEDHIAKLKAMGPRDGGWLTDDFHEAAARFCGAHLEEIEAAWQLYRAHQGQEPVAWLVEAPGANYLAVRTLGRSEFYWTSDPNKALRFFTKDEADQTAMAVRRMAPELWGFALTLGEAWPREHKWIATHQPAISTDRSGTSAKTPIPGGDASNGAADHEGAGT